VPKTLTLKVRRGGAWEDAAVLINVLEFLAKGKTFAKAAMWFGIAGKVQLAIDAKVDQKNGSEPASIGEVAIELSNQEAKVLSKNLFDVPGEQFGRNLRTGEPALPPLGTLNLMLHDFADALGIQLPEQDEEGDE